MKYAPLVAVVCLLFFWAGYLGARSQSNPSPDCSTLVNGDYLDCLGTANDVLNGCVIFLGNGDDMKTLLFLGDGQDRNRLTAVCVPK